MNLYATILLLSTTINSFSIPGVDFDLQQTEGQPFDHNNLVEQAIAEKSDEDIITITSNNEPKQVKVKDLRDYLNKQKNLLTNMKKDKDGSIVKEDSGRMTMDEIAKGGDRNMQMFVTLGRVGHQLLLSQNYGYTTLSGLQSSPRLEQREDGTLKPYPDLLILTTKNKEGVEKNFECEFELDFNKYEYPGFAVVNAWEVGEGEGRERLRRIEDLKVPGKPTTILGYRPHEVGKLLEDMRWIGVGLIVVGLGSFGWAGKTKVG